MDAKLDSSSKVERRVASCVVRFSAALTKLFRSLGTEERVRSVVEEEVLMEDFG